MKKLLTLYICILFVILASAQTKINDTIIHNFYSNKSIYQVIENYKDSVIIDSEIKIIRMINLFCIGDYGGTLDIFDCKTDIDNDLVRQHSYGWRLEINNFNDDKYYKDGKLIRWIKAEELKNEVEGKSYVRIHIFEVE